MVCPAVEHRCIRRSAGTVRGQKTHVTNPSGGRLRIGHTPALLKRMDITGARWGLEGAEAILKLRALIATGDFEDYWRFHLRQEHKRIHGAIYGEDLTLAA